jgi:hypothetical protein
MFVFYLLEEEKKQQEALETLTIQEAGEMGKHKTSTNRSANRMPFDIARRAIDNVHG